MNKIKNTLTAIIITLIFVFVFFVTYNLAEPKAYDFMTKQFAVKSLPFDKIKKVNGDKNIVLVVIDAQTVEKYRWPWKRDFDAKVLEYFSKYTQAKVVIDDKILISSDANYPMADKKLYNTISKLDNYVAGFMPNMLPWKEPISGRKYGKYFASKYSININDKSAKEIIPYNSLLSSPYNYLASAKNLGHVYFPVGGLNKNISSWAFDNITRTNEYIIESGEGFYPSLALKAYLMLNPDSKITLKDKSILIEGSQKREIKLLPKAHVYHGLGVLKLDTNSNPIRFYQIDSQTGYSHPKISLLDVIESYNAIKLGKKPPLNADVFKDKIVLLGGNVPAGAGLNDNKNTSVAVNHPGVDIQATALDNIINNDFLKIVPMWLNVFLTLLGMLFVYGFIRVFDLTKSITSALFVIVAYFIITSVCFYNGIVINVLTPVVMFVLTMILAYTHKFVIENKSKEKVKSAMGKYMSQDVMKRVIQNIDNLGLGGKKSVVTVLFADIRGFTSMSEQMSAQQVSEILNEYFTEMEPIITKYNGVINKFIGDAVMAIFGEPIQDKNHAQNAVKCAYAMLQKVKELQKKWAKENKPKIEIGIGVNTGEVFVGNIGSVNRMEYTVIGDTVNLASRLESYNKIYRTKLLISPSTYEEVKGFTDVIKISDVQIRGKANKMDIYEVLKVTELNVY